MVGAGGKKTETANAKSEWVARANSAYDNYHTLHTLTLTHRQAHEYLGSVPKLKRFL